ncbi:MAG TPA: HAD family hydrolase [Chloroflexia bacterium]|jgi:HAD superfamily hydrolase (TIGR01549 family)
MKKVVLFDFHNTLATCASWLELEITTLPGLALSRLAGRGVLDAGARERTGEATAHFKALRQRVRESGVELSAVQGVTQVLDSLGYSVPQAETESVVAELENECLPEVEMVEGADVALRQLHNAGCLLGVVSSAGYPLFVEMALEKLGLRTYFNEVVTSAGEGIYKSDPEIFRRAVSRLGARPSDAVHIGDHAVYDVRTAKAAGLSAIWFVAEARNTARLHGTEWSTVAEAGEEADAVVESMAELYDAISALYMNMGRPTSG